VSDERTALRYQQRLAGCTVGRVLAYSRDDRPKRIAVNTSDEQRWNYAAHPLHSRNTQAAGTVALFWGVVNATVPGFARSFNSRPVLKIPDKRDAVCAYKYSSRGHCRVAVGTRSRYRRAHAAARLR